MDFRLRSLDPGTPRAWDADRPVRCEICAPRRTLCLVPGPYVFVVADVVVLLGAPGSGKSTIGAQLRRRGCRWRDWEMVILERWGSRDQFIADKATALPALHEEIRRWITSEAPPAVLETTGLSDAPLRAELARTHDVLTVRLDVSETEALRRIAARQRDRHLTDDLEANRLVWQAFQDQVSRTSGVDLTIDTEARPVEEVVAAISEALRYPPCDRT